MEFIYVFWLAGSWLFGMMVGPDAIKHASLTDPVSITESTSTFKMALK